ncbi:MAG TPA: CHAT domain-containing protein, partial [Candidatus Polarisedimenticolaceae bacterium]|nr:CHAT domain-containing protein [Candidatus Polarisedimenticolaceae bacterium]
AEGRLDEAVGSLRAALEQLERQAAPLDPLQEGMRFLRERADPYADLAAALVARGDPPARVLEVTSRAKSRVLRCALDAAPADLAALQRALVPGELLVDYLVGEDRGTLVAVTREGARAARIPGRRILGPALERWRAGIAAPVELSPEVRLAGTELRRALFDPIEEMLGPARRLYVVADRNLALLPFASLPAPGADPDRYLGEQVEIAMLPLASAPLRLDGHRAPLLLGGQPAFAPGSGFAELPWSAYELSRLRELWGADETTLLGGTGFTAEAFRKLELRRFRTIHLATHAEASTLDPRRCGIVFSGGERIGIDELGGLALPGSLVVLSACRTGEGELLPGEGVVGLGWALLRGGAGAVVVSLWTVDDASAAKLMLAFHGHLRDGAEPVAALAAASRELARARRHPAYWAPFVVVLRPL